MSVQANISITLTADSVAAVEELIKGLNLPDGANVWASTTEHVVSGTVEGGEVKQAELAPTGTPPPENGEAPAT